MNQDTRGLIEAVLGQDKLHFNELPALDLYMDQIITLIEGKYASVRRTDDQKLLTKTMINNYSKAGLIKPVSGKKYTREQILQMLTVFELKDTLSLGEIQQMMCALYAQEAFDGAALAVRYEGALQRETSLREPMTHLMEQAIGDDDSAEGIFEAILSLSVLSQNLQGVAQRLIDHHFPAASHSKREIEQSGGHSSSPSKSVPTSAKHMQKH